MGKPNCKNNGTDELRGNCAADQSLLFFRFIEMRVIKFLINQEIFIQGSVGQF